MLVDALLESANTRGDVCAVTDGAKSLTYRQLARLSRVLRDCIVKSTDAPRVGIMLPASTAFPATLFGALWASKTVVPLNFLLQPEELTRIVLDSEIDTIVTVRPFEKLASQLDVKIVYLEDLHLKRKMVWATLRSFPPAPVVDKNDTAVLLYTSGTSGDPKGVELTYENLRSNCVDTIASLNVDPKQTFLNILPPFHIFGLTANVLLPVVLGATVFAIPRFNPLAVLRAVKEHQISIIMAIPSMYAAMLRSKSAKSDTFDSIYLAITGGEPLSDSIVTEFEQRFGLTLRQGYGLSETSPVLSVGTRDAFKNRTVGRPIRNVQIRIIDEQGREVQASDDGEILVRSPGVMKGYFKKPDETKSVLGNDGWFRTGDIGNVDSDGFLSITGRSKEMMIIGGENVFPREIESVLESHDAVLQAAVIGAPDGMRGEVPIAFVIPQKDATVTSDELRSFARKSLANFKTPRRIEIRDDLPTGPTGKILKRKLREQI
jgi:long-chain acyl-CoA synthetase